MSKAKKYYAVRVGRQTGVFDNWADCEAQVKGFKGAKFKSFASKSMAEHALKHGWDIGSMPQTEPTPSSDVVQDYIKQSISVDAACSGNPGELEYQCVNTETGEQIFGSKRYPVGTNNLGEFLAIVDGLRYLHEMSDSVTPIYSDSVSALAWVRNGKVKTNLIRNADTEKLWQDIESAIDWLHSHSYSNPVLKWETKRWGESKADFGRK